MHGYAAMERVTAAAVHAAKSA